MKKFSKVLCLVLVLAMMAGLCCFSTSAAYADADKITYKEAVDVMSAIGVLQGDENGFRPQDTLTRAEACKIVAYLTGAGDISTACSFKDCANHWAANYIGYCAAQGYVNGYSAAKFGPDDTLTGYAFAKMLFGALGYDAELEGMTGAAWEVGVAKLVKTTALSLGLAKFVGAANITREEAAQLGFNALTKEEVTYNERLERSSNGTTTTSMSVKASAITGATLWDDNFKLLKKNPSTGDSADAFNRPINTWYYSGKLVGSYGTATPAMTYNKAIVLPAEIATLKEGIKGFANYGKTLTCYLNGATKAMTFKEVDVAGLSANGRVMELYVDVTTNTVSRIVAYDTVLAKVTKVDDTAKTVNYAVSNGAANFNLVNQTKGYGDYKLGDYVVLTATKKGDGLLDDAADLTLQSTAAATVVTGLATKYSAAGITLGDQLYTKAATCWAGDFATNAKLEATLYTDANGFVLYAKSGAAAVVDKAVIVTKAYASTNAAGAIIAMIEGVTSNGETVNWQYTKVNNVTTDVVTSTGVAVAGTVYVYDVGAAGAYTLATTGIVTSYDNGKTVYIASHAALTPATKSLSFAGATTTPAYIASGVKTIFTNPTTKVATVVDGVAAVAADKPIYVTCSTALDGAKYITAIFVPSAAAPSTATATGDIVFVAAETAGKVSTINSVTGLPETFDTYAAYVDGAVVADFYAASGAASGFYYGKVSPATGAYELTGNEYAVTVGTMAVQENLAVLAGAGSILTTTAGDFDLTSAVIVDTTATPTTADPIDTLKEIVDNCKTTNISIMYNATTKAVAYVYVVNPGAEALTVAGQKLGVTNNPTARTSVITVSDAVKAGDGNATIDALGFTAGDRVIGIKVPNVGGYLYYYTYSTGDGVWYRHNVEANGFEYYLSLGPSGANTIPKTVIFSNLEGSFTGYDYIYVGSANFDATNGTTWTITATIGA